MTVPDPAMVACSQQSESGVIFIHLAIMSVNGLPGGHGRGYLGPVNPQDGLDAEAGIKEVRIRGSRLLLRALQPG